jgi:CheY-like chemotaxis protein
VSGKIAGRRILVIEDSPVVAPFTQAVLEELGCEVVGPAGNMAVARELAEQDGIDAALIDVRIRGEKSYPICEILNRRGVPFVLTSGYAEWGVPAEWRDRPQLPKPYKVADLEAALLEALS